MLRCRFATLVLGFDPRTALAVARSLHAQGIRVVVGTVADWETPTRSTAVEAFVPLQDNHEAPSDFLDRLWAVIQTREIDTIIPVTDRALLLLAPYAHVLSARVRLAMPTAEQIGLVLDKFATAEIATQLGIRVPNTNVVPPGSTSVEFLGRLSFPAFIKSRDKSELCRRRKLAGQDARYCADLQAFAAMSSSLHPGMMVQEYIPGDDVGLAVLLHEGNVVNAFQYRARKVQPAEGGVCVLACSEAVDPLLLDWAVRLLRRLKWQGLAQLDFRHDRVTGSATFLEINGRFWGSTAAAIRSGADFPFQVWQLIHGQTPVVSAYREGVLVRWLEGDFRRLCGLFATSPDRTRVAVRETLRFLLDFRPTVKGMFWAWRDPFPALLGFRNMSRCWIASRWRTGEKPSSEERHQDVDTVPTASV